VRRCGSVRIELRVAGEVTAGVILELDGNVVGEFHVGGGGDDGGDADSGTHPGGNERGCQHHLLRISRRSEIFFPESKMRGFSNSTRWALALATK